MERLDLAYANANVGGPSTFAGMLEDWFHLPLATVFVRRVTSDTDDMLFVKSLDSQYRVEFPFQTFTPDEAVAFAESLAEDFARHRVKTDPDQIRAALTPFVTEPSGADVAGWALGLLRDSLADADAQRAELAPAPKKKRKK